MVMVMRRVKRAVEIVLMRFERFGARRKRKHNDQGSEMVTTEEVFHHAHHHVAHGLLQGVVAHLAVS